VVAVGMIALLLGCDRVHDVVFVDWDGAQPDDGAGGVGTRGGLMPGADTAEGGAAETGGAVMSPADGGPLDGGNGSAVEARPADGPADGHVADVTPPPPDAGAPDSAPKTGCQGALASALLCEGFEDVELPRWQRLVSNGSVVRVTQPVLVGMGALEARSVARGGNGFMIAGGLGGKTSGTLHLRAHVRVPVGVALNGVTVLALGENHAPRGGISVVLADSGLLVVLKPRGQQAPEVIVAGSGPTPFRIARDRWQCVQLQTVIGRGSGSVRLSVDGQVAVQSGGVDTLPAGGFEEVSVGMVYSTPDQTPIKIGVDELAVSANPLPCN
jgi:hypothetical protein